MKSLPEETCRLWITPQHLHLDENRYIRSSAMTDRPAMYVVTENLHRGRAEFCRRLLDWLPAGRERLLIVSSSWPFPDQLEVFGAIRRGCGVTAPLAETPGHLFISTKDESTHYDDRPEIDVKEESIAMWMAALMLEWTWEGYLMAKDSPSFVRLGDGFIEFVTNDDERLAAANSIIGDFGLKSRTTFPWQQSE